MRVRATDAPMVQVALTARVVNRVTLATDPHVEFIQLCTPGMVQIN